MKFAIAQMSCVPGDVSANLARMADFAAQARDQGCDAIAYPEMSDTGYELDAIRRHAGPIDGTAFTRLKDIAAKNALHIIAGLSERDDAAIYNTSAVFTPQGTLAAKYRKTHLFAVPPVNEHEAITAGDSLTLLPIAGLTIGLLICYDLRFPELARTLTLRGADVLVIIAAWPFPRLLHWTTLAAARAIENQVYVVAANRCGADRQSTYCGSSRILDPYGTLITTAAEDREQLLTAEIQPELLRWARGRMPALQHRREELYRV